MAADGANRRGDERLGVQLPMRVQGYDTDGRRWEEMTSADDVSSTGAGFPLRHAVVKGQALFLSMPLPKRYRQHDTASSSYHVYALVRTVAPLDEGARIGALFIGKNPPRGYEENPGTRYLLPGEKSPTTKASERRAEPRFSVFLNLRLERETGLVGALEEQTVAENLSRRGAQVPTTLPVAKGEILNLAEIGGDFRCRAEVRNLYIGKDGIPRLNLRFLDAEIPDRLIS
jgi:PilZ domain-containing protein